MQNLPLSTCQEPTMIQSIRWENDQLTLLDQRKLPGQTQYLHYTAATDVAQAITDMVVRGAPAIGITAAYAMALTAKSSASATLFESLSTAHAQLAASRPTAVNLFWALEQCQEVIARHAKDNPSDEDSVALYQALVTLAQSMHNADIAQNQTIANYGADFIKSARAVYTHCNTGALATGGVGTALGIIRALHARNAVAHVYAGETRPWLQGARLTAWELQQEGIAFDLVADSSSGYLMATEAIDAIVVGADRIAANGDVANKIGTYTLAVLAKHHNIPFIVAAPMSSFDLTIASGSDITIEQRAADEVTHIQGLAIAPENCPAKNIAFDVTPHTLITAIVTEHGVITSPNTQSVADILKR